MIKSDWLLGEKPNPLEDRVDEIRAELRKANPQRLANQTGSVFNPQGESGGQFKLPLWNRDVILDFPAFTGYEAESKNPLSTFELTLLAYYFQHSDSTPMTGNWMAFSELRDGRFYAQAFQSYTGKRLTQVFGNDVDVFTEAAARLGGRREFFANRSFSYQVLPRVALLVACWLGDEDFPPSYRILFDTAIGHHLTTDACAVLGSQLTHS